MKFCLNKILSVSALLALATLTIAAPLQDVSVTSIDLVENTYNAQGDEHLFVTVTRVDDLLDDDGSLLAERIMAVRVTFDVYENQLMCNGKPVEIGVSNIQVEAQMASNPAKLSITSEEDAAILADSFDVGLVTVEVTASILDELKTDDGMVFRRISVQELITEINGQKVVQTEAGQQILDVFDNGALIKWSVDPLTGFMLPGPEAAKEENFLDFVECPGCNGVDNWWNEASNLSQGLVMGAICAFFLGFVMAVRQLVSSKYSSYEHVVLTEDESSEQIWAKKEQPPAYIEQEQTTEEKKPFLA
ncbi:uncharacterized protein EV154DRAFT_556893 [Mucor mucedo]|uniref:Uncharacterized protein n=1 Tax=Mucor saturninus TaxID=64648 RepID=A0A8H7QYK7_9FUNG|nr:uncharacterized protein EV154DRAFT_556893 [Mucor mucedo]KAG2200620.1 hypothetical protein INT47_007364 [Mucor saturninus]KAI7868033.1 hypothetical protein EV154DRAFT_556893 [Mucor mucedo]